MLKFVYPNQSDMRTANDDALREICNAMARTDRTLDRIDVTRPFGDDHGSAMELIKTAKTVAADHGLDVYVHLHARTLRLTFVHRCVG